MLKYNHQIWFQTHLDIEQWGPFSMHGWVRSKMREHITHVKYSVIGWELELPDIGNGPFLLLLICQCKTKFNIGIKYHFEYESTTTYFFTFWSITYICNIRLFDYFLSMIIFKYK